MIGLAGACSARGTGDANALAGTWTLQGTATWSLTLDDLHVDGAGPRGSLVNTSAINRPTLSESTVSCPLDVVPVFDSLVELHGDCDTLPNHYRWSLRGTFQESSGRHVLHLVFNDTVMFDAHD